MTEYRRRASRTRSRDRNFAKKFCSALAADPRFSEVLPNVDDRNSAVASIGVIADFITSLDSKMNQPQYHDPRIVFELSRMLIDGLQQLFHAVRNEGEMDRAVRTLSPFTKSLSKAERVLTEPGYSWNSTKPTTIAGFPTARDAPVSIFLASRKVWCNLIVAIGGKVEWAVSPEAAVGEQLASAARGRTEIARGILEPCLLNMEFDVATAALEIEYVAAQHSPIPVSGIKLPPLIEDLLSAVEALPGGWANMDRDQQLAWVRESYSKQNECSTAGLAGSKKDTKKDIEEISRKNRKKRPNRHLGEHAVRCVRILNKQYHDYKVRPVIKHVVADYVDEQNEGLPADKHLKVGTILKQISSNPQVLNWNKKDK